MSWVLRLEYGWLWAIVIAVVWGVAAEFFRRGAFNALKAYRNSDVGVLRSVALFAGFWLFLCAGWMLMAGSFFMLAHSLSVVSVGMVIVPCAALFVTALSFVTPKRTTGREEDDFRFGESSFSRLVISAAVVVFSAITMSTINKWDTMAGMTLTPQQRANYSARQILKAPTNPDDLTKSKLAEDLWRYKRFSGVRANSLLVAIAHLKLGEKEDASREFNLHHQQGLASIKEDWPIWAGASSFAAGHYDEAEKLFKKAGPLGEICRVASNCMVQAEGAKSGGIKEPLFRLSSTLDAVPLSDDEQAKVLREIAWKEFWRFLRENQPTLPPEPAVASKQRILCIIVGCLAVFFAVMLATGFILERRSARLGCPPTRFYQW